MCEHYKGLTIFIQKLVAWHFAGPLFLATFATVFRLMAEVGDKKLKTLYNNGIRSKRIWNSDGKVGVGCDRTRYMSHWYVSYLFDG